MLFPRMQNVGAFTSLRHQFRHPAVGLQGQPHVRKSPQDLFVPGTVQHPAFTRQDLAVYHVGINLVEDPQQAKMPRIRLS